MNITVNSYFSGAGLFDIGLQEGGLHIGQSFEIDKTCCDTQRFNFSHDVVQGDIRDKTVLQAQTMRLTG
jgi:DNA (cytosine-5)-methyltransferase 1